MAYTLEIERGYINTYVPLKFDYSTIDEYSELIGRLEQSYFVISNQTNDEDGTYIDLKPNFYEICNRITNTFAAKNSSEIDMKIQEFDSDGQAYIRVTNVSNSNDNPTLTNQDSILLKFIKLVLEDDYPKLRISSISDIEDFANSQLEEIVEDANFSSKIFGTDISKAKKVLMLWPILVIDSNNENQPASVIIEFYDLGLAMLRISYPIVSQCSLPLSQNNSNLYHESCYYNFNYDDENFIEMFDYQKISSNSINEVIDIILRWLHVNSNGFTRSENREIILLSQLKPNNVDILKATKEEREAIFRIVNAPIQDDNNLHSDRNKLWEEQFWGDEYFRYYFSTMGKCVAIVGRDIEGILPSVESKEVENDIVDRSLLSNVENAYKLMLFNKLNNQNFLILQTKVNYQQLRNLEDDYYLTENYILGLLDYSYGSVRDLYNKMVSLSHHYLNQDSIERRLSNNNKILRNRQSDRVSKENDRLTILGLLITIFVSFPAIYESLDILRDSFIKDSIRGVSVIGLSIIVEIIFLFFLLYWYTNRDK